ncbi:AAA-ATPase ASD, mitochondrial-like [Tripterygium wilfordii]|uniref:AAA-ATPase ASD, mitochondrial-like n=1 Tax=Tripterygium wilfordii TaxID=458696 RepID=UPI0018F80BD0|nr:AAA-ATPase ASD, mitochondrial-like [Tripterygium wilfordii]
MAEMMTQLGSAFAGMMFIWAIFRDHFPYQIRGFIERYFHRLMNLVYPYIQITFPELTGERMKRSEAYSRIESYLSANSTKHAKRLKADVVKDSQSLILSMDDQEEVADEYNGIKLWWVAVKHISQSQSFSYRATSEERRFYKLTFHKRDREIITGSYIDHVLREGKAIAAKNRERKLFTNNPSNNWDYYKATKWSHVIFEHPASFDTLAMEGKKKEEIKKDLIKFSQSKDYYAKIGKAWKRGYLLYGPPGTGKSTMIAAMANFLNYDIYDLELTTVKDNTDLRRLLIETKNKSIIVIEDIDCSLDLTGQRKKKKEKKKDENEENKDQTPQKPKEEEESKSKVTLSGLLNFIDGLWSACGGEKIIIFTTNFVDRLDPALIRTGRMDKHIEMSYCCFEAFKVLAKNYLDIESHDLFDTIARLLKETDMTPADVAENLMPKSLDDEVEICLNRFIKALELAKEEARKKSEEEARLKAENERLASVQEDVKENGVAVKEVKENGFLDKKESVKE